MAGSIDMLLRVRENPVPVPLKHFTETAYLVFLGLLICAAGFLAALLPDLPVGLPYWALAFSVASLYPMFLMPTFRHNRADYEFRLLHWFPAAIFALWMLLQLSDPYWTWFHILNLGFLAFWSLPLVVLGLGLGIAFSVHVLRRRTVRVTLLSIFLIAFTAGAVMAEAEGWNDRLQAQIYTGNPVTFLRPVVARLRSFAQLLRYPQGSGSTVAVTGTTSTSSSIRSSSRSLARSQENDPFLSSSVISEHTPEGLPKSGPESAAVLFATLVALYTGTLHTRSRKRA